MYVKIVLFLFLFCFAFVFVLFLFQEFDHYLKVMEDKRRQCLFCLFCPKRIYCSCCPCFRRDMTTMMLHDDQEFLLDAAPIGSEPPDIIKSQPSPNV